MLRTKRRTTVERGRQDLTAKERNEGKALAAGIRTILSAVRSNGTITPEATETVPVAMELVSALWLTPTSSGVAPGRFRDRQAVAPIVCKAPSGWVGGVAAARSGGLEPVAVVGGEVVVAAEAAFEVGQD